MTRNGSDGTFHKKETPVSNAQQQRELCALVAGIRRSRVIDKACRELIEAGETHSAVISALYGVARELTLEDRERKRREWDELMQSVKQS